MIADGPRPGSLSWISGCPRRCRSSAIPVSSHARPAH